MQAQIGPIALGLFLSTVLFGSAPATSAGGPTAEETVAFMLFGVEEGAPIHGDNKAARQKNGRWRLDERWELEVAEVGRCKFSTKQFVDGVEKLPLEFDLSNLVGYNAGVIGKDVVVVFLKGPNILSTEYPPLGGGEPTRNEWGGIVLSPAATEARLERAAAYFQLTFCPF